MQTEKLGTLLLLVLFKITPVTHPCQAYEGMCDKWCST